MELSRHDIETCEGRYGRGDQRRRAGRRLCSGARARVAAEAVEWNGEACVGRSAERGGVVGDRARGGVRCSSQLYAWRKQIAGGELEADRAMATFARIEVNDLPEVELRSRRP